MTVFEAWSDPSDESILLASVPLRSANILGPDAVLLYRFEAATVEEASSIHALRMGWDPYCPTGAAASCPVCGATYYPAGSGECWRCETEE